MNRWKERSSAVPSFLPHSRLDSSLFSRRNSKGTKEEQEERNTEKNKASKGTSIPIHPYPDSSSSLLTSASNPHLI